MVRLIEITNDEVFDNGMILYRNQISTDNLNN
jgi:hypothetical protein